LLVHGRPRFAHVVEQRKATFAHEPRIDLVAGAQLRDPGLEFGFRADTEGCASCFMRSGFT